MVRHLKIRLAIAASAAVALGLLSPRWSAGGVVTYRLGDQDFTQGQGPILVEQSRIAGKDEAFPFDGTVFGDDRTPRFGRIQFNYNFQAPPAGDGTLTLGLLGLDSPPGDGPTVKLFLDGVEQPNNAFAGVSSAQFRSSASVVTIPVPWALLADGKLDVSIRAFRRSRGFPGNAIAADFSTLTMNSTTGSSGGNGGTDGGTDGGNGGGNPDGSGNNGGSNGGNNGGSNGNGGTDGGNGGGGDNEPPHSVPLPPAVWAGIAGLLLAAWARRKI